MNKLKILTYLCVFMSTGLKMNWVIAAENSFLAQTCQSTSEQFLEDSQKRRREAGDVDENSGSRAGLVAFKRKVGRAGLVAFKRKVGRAGLVAFKRKVGRAGLATFKSKVGQGTENIMVAKRKTEKIKLPAIIAPLAPQSTTGLTTTAQPTLYWYMSSEWQYEMGFTLNEFGASEPLLERNIQQKTQCQPYLQGDFICHLNLADYDVQLQPNREYEWFVFIVFDLEQRTSDWLASAAIRYEPSSKPLSLEPTTTRSLYQDYQSTGFWYDDLAQLMTPIQNQSSNATFLTAASHLLEQEQMPIVAEYLQQGCQECYYEVEVES
ncbi:MAG: DUF928 domain-containing protein [Thioploca sp.]|nr:DUF928 domain-containing protein [Thioploca sp.]